jgi:hypothetical protein
MADAAADVDAGLPRTRREQLADAAALADDLRAGVKQLEPSGHRGVEDVRRGLRLGQAILLICTDKRRLQVGSIDDCVREAKGCD